MRKSLLLLLLLFTQALQGQNFEPDSKAMPSFLDSIFNKGIENSLIPGGIVGIVHQGRLVHAGAYGYANVKDETAVDFSKTRFQLGSVGKLLAALAVLKEVEAGRLDLRKDVNQYLSDFSVGIPDEPVTLHHLLTHTAGFNDRIIGYATRDSHQLESLAEHLKKRMPGAYTSPGKEISYSNYGFGLAGHLVELSSGLDFKDYVRTEIFEPLDMQSATYQSPRLNQESYAMGYEAREQFNLVSPMPRHVTPAGSVMATGEDLVKFLDALLSHDKRLLSEDGYDYITNRQFSPHSLLSGHAYGIEEQNFNGHKGFGKGGNIPGFLAYLVLFPQYDFGMFVAVNTETDNFLESFAKAFKDRFFPRLGGSSQPIKALEKLDHLAGDFRANRYNRNTIEDLFGLIAGSSTVYNSGDSSLALFHNGRMQYYHPIDDLLFQNTRDPELFLVFEKRNGKITHMHRNVNIGGFSIPLTYERVPWFSTVHFVNEYAGLFPIFNLSYLLFPFFWLIILLIKKKKEAFRHGMGFKSSTRLITILFTVLVAISGITVFKYVKLGEALIFGIPNNIRLLQSLTFLLPIVLIMLLYRTIRVWFDKEGNLASRIYLSIYTLSGSVYLLILHQWHFIGVHY